MDKAQSYEGRPSVTVGIMSSEKLFFTLNGRFSCAGCMLSGDQCATVEGGQVRIAQFLERECVLEPCDTTATFTLHGVTIGISYHWQRKENQTFTGRLHLIVENDKVTAVNELPIEHYLVSVISSEMSATAGLEFLKASAIISRSWLLAQIRQRNAAKTAVLAPKADMASSCEMMSWTDREAHTRFDVCADDHCQRYQGITKARNPNVAEAVRSTAGEVLTYGDEICDARFSKCCGGVSEIFSTCWEDRNVPYLSAVRDDADETPLPDLTDEVKAARWIRCSVPAFCCTADEGILHQVLNDFDQETHDFYRWRVEYSQTELSALIRKKTGIDFGSIVDLKPVARGKSGRLYKMLIEGTKRSVVIGKELAIRDALSESHLYSSAFIVEKGPLTDGIPSTFTLLGAGWGHGVGMCQIGAAVMGAEGYTYDKILLHYYKGAQITKLY